MRLEGKVWKDGKQWLAEISALDYLTQGSSKREALKMAKDIVETGVDRKGFKVKVTDASGDRFTIQANDSGLLVAHMLRRLRQKSGLTVRDAAQNLGSTSPNAFGVYEQGRATPTLEKLEELLKAVNAKRSLILKVA